MPQDFTAPPTQFFGARGKSDLTGADIAIFGAPHGTPYTGIDNTPYARAPDALRNALRDDRDWEDHWDFDCDAPFLADDARIITDLGNLKTTSADGVGNRDKIRAATQDIISAGCIPILLGGDDSVPIPFFEGLADRGPLTVVQVDAHIDWRHERCGEPLGFSSTMRRASEMPHIDNIIHVGIRGIGSARREEVEAARAWGAQIVTAHTIHREGMQTVLDQLAPNTNVVLTIDCDGLDAGIMPAVMAPTPGGLTYDQILELVHGLVARTNLVACDMIEFVPERDPTGTAGITAARIMANVVGALARA
ncbi:MAG: arginase family protein [Pseudomonadota bacterium]